MNQFEDVLAWVNQTRAQFDIGPALEALPQGRPNSGTDCPVACALSGVAVFPTVCTFNTYLCGAADGDIYITNPDHVSEFIKAFDAGEYSELVA